MLEEKSYLFKDLVYLCITGIIVCLPFICIDVVPKRDTAHYYLPMINAFADSRFSDAYYPSIPPLFSTLGGLLKMMTGLPTLTCGKIISSSFFILTIIPLYMLATLLRGRAIAVCSSILLIFCSKLIDYAGAALLDTGKTFFITASVCAIFYFHKKNSMYRGLFCSLSFAGLALIRGEGVIFSIIGLFIILIIESKVIEKGQNKSIPVKSLICSVLFILLLSPWLNYQIDKTGFPVTDSRQSASFNSLIGREKSLNLPIDPASHIADKRVSYSRTEKGLWESLFKGLIKGMYLPYLILFLMPALYTKVKSKTLANYEKIILGFFFLHAFILAAIVGWWTQSRYIIAALPPLLIICSESLLFMKNRIRSNNIKAIVAILAISLSLYKGYGELYPEKQSKAMQKENLKNAALWLKGNKNRFIKDHYKRKSSTQIHYHSGEFPIVYSATAQLSILAEVGYVEPMRYKNPETTIEEVLDLLLLKEVDLLVIDSRLREYIPELSNLWQVTPELKFIKKFGEGENEVIIMSIQKDKYE